MREFTLAELEAIRVDSQKQPSAKQPAQIIDMIPQTWTPAHLARRLAQAFATFSQMNTPGGQAGRAADVEVRWMEDCNAFLRWYRHQDVLGALILARCALARAEGVPLAKIARSLDLPESKLTAHRRTALAACAEMLNRKSVAVF